MNYKIYCCTVKSLEFKDQNWKFKYFSSNFKLYSLNFKHKSLNFILKLYALQ